jgi:leader peptidase (prepilin peptidase) / N-methyltransferase
VSGAAGAAAAGAVVGALAGWGVRGLLAVIPRGGELPLRVLVPAAAAITAVGAALTVDTPRIGLALWVGIMLIALGGIDLARHRLPDALTLPAIPITAAITGITQWLAPGSGSVGRALLAGAVLFVLFGALSVLSGSAMGRGDVKLVPSLGIASGFLSWTAVLVAVTAAFVLGALVALAGVASRRMTAGSRFAFGPYLILGCWLVVVFS